MRWFVEIRSQFEGPFDADSLKDLLARNEIDGLSLCRLEGDHETRALSDVPELKAALLTSFEESNNDDDSALPEEISVRSLGGTDLAALILGEPTTIDSAAPGTNEATNSEISEAITKKRPVPVTAEEQSENDIPRRAPLDEVPEKFKYVGPDGKGKVFDAITKSWVSFATYLNMVKEKGSYAEIATNNTEAKKSARKREELQRKRQRGEWMRPKTNPNIYVSGLPLDVTENELANTFKRAGILKIDPQTGLPKIRIYKTKEGAVKGDALITFVHETSVALAERYFDKSDLRGDGSVISVSQAHFDTSDKAAKPVSATERKVLQEQYLAAKREQQRLQGLEKVQRQTKVLILRPLWSRKEAALWTSGDLRYTAVRDRVSASLKSWCAAKAVTPIERHPQGIVCVKLSSPEEVEFAAARLNERGFDILDLQDRQLQMLHSLFLERLPDLRRSFNGAHPALDAEQLQLLESFKQSNDFTQENLELLPTFIATERIIFEAFPYDGVTNLASQALPETYLEGMTADEPTPSDTLPSNVQSSKSWEQWLIEGDNAEDDDEEDLQIKTEEDFEDHQS